MSPHTAALESYSRAHDDAGAIRDAQQRADEAALERAREDWLRWFAKNEAAGDLACDLPRCDGDAWEAVAGLIASALREPWSSDGRKRAEEVVDALAQLAVDREVAG